ncbi:MAG: hypothetical protein EBZ36_11770 [Acidobacteria bacterium]|nr:hypothetical protein [Acidobacteriota bacterium]
MTADILAVLVIGLGVGNGIGLARGWLAGLDRREWFGFGVVIGLAGLAWLGLAVLLTIGPGLAAWLTIVGVELIMFAWLVWAGWLRLSAGCRLLTTGRRIRALHTIRSVIWYGGWVLLLGWIASRVVGFDESGMITSPANNYGDLAFHLSVISSFAYGGNLPPENPIYAGTSFTYPFLIDLLTAIPAGMGAGWQTSFFIVNFPLLLSLVAIMESLGRRLTGSLRAGRLAAIVFVFNGGLGFLKFCAELTQFQPLDRLNGVAGLLANLPETYTINNHLSFVGIEIPLHYGNLITSLLIPQRSLLFGLPVAGMIIILWRLGLDASDVRECRRRLLGAGILSGMLPLLHAHGFMAVMMAAVPLALIFRRREWGAFFLPAVTLALPQALWLGQTGARKALFNWHFWWEAGEVNPLLFWLANTGLFLVLLVAVIAALTWRRDRRLVFYLPFLLWFIVPNLVQLAPWVWDNIKIFVYWGMVSSILVGLGLTWLAGSRRVILRAAGLALLALLTLSGLLDVWRGLSPVEKVVLLTQEDLRVAARLREMTEPRALILHAPIHNSPVILTGRRSLMGYPGHLWSHGIDYAEREADLREMMLFSPRAVGLLRSYGVDYVLTEEDGAGYRERYSLVFVEGGRSLYRISGN